MMRIFSRFMRFRGSTPDPPAQMSEGELNHDPYDSDVNLLDPINGDGNNDDDVPLIDSELHNHTTNEPSDDRPSFLIDENDRDAALIEPDPVDAHAMSRHERAMRHRSRRHRHRHRSRNRLCRCKRKETNFLASMCSMVVVVLMCTSLAEPEWFFISGGKCRDTQQPVAYLGVKLFFYKGLFANNGHNTPPTGSDVNPQSIYYYGTSRNEVLLDCVTPTIVFTMKCIIMNCFIVIIFSLTAFVLDLVGPTHRVLRAIRTNAVFSILSVCLCLTINGLCYLITEQLNEFFASNPFKPGSRIDVQFSLSYYIVTAAGAMAVFATACNLFQRPTSSDRHVTADRRDRMIAELQPGEGGFSACSQFPYLPSPPPYTP